ASDSESPSSRRKPLSSSRRHAMSVPSGSCRLLARAREVKSGSYQSLDMSDPHSTRRDFRHTKIVCTLGPATSDAEVLRSLANAGMNIARLNMSHGDHASHADLIQKIKSLNE